MNTRTVNPSVFGRPREDRSPMIRVDFHTHTADDPWDWIPYTSAELVRRASEVGLDAVAITLHDRQYDIDGVADLARELKVTLLPGIERTIEGRHVLLLNFPPDVAYVTSFERLAAIKADYPNGLIIAPHPFYPLSNCLRALADRHADLFDAVEYNGCYTTLLNFNRGVKRWAAARGKPVVGSSDAHRLSVLGATCSLVDAPGRGVDEICAAVKAGRVELSTAPMSPAHLATYLARMLLGGHKPAAGVDEGVSRPARVSRSRSRRGFRLSS